MTVEKPSEQVTPKQKPTLNWPFLVRKKIYARLTDAHAIVTELTPEDVTLTLREFNKKYFIPGEAGALVSMLISALRPTRIDLKYIINVSRSRKSDKVVLCKAFLNEENLYTTKQLQTLLNKTQVLIWCAMGGLIKGEPNEKDAHKGYAGTPSVLREVIIKHPEFIENPVFNDYVRSRNLLIPHIFTDTGEVKLSPTVKQKLGLSPLKEAELVVCAEELCTRFFIDPAFKRLIHLLKVVKPLVGILTDIEKEEESCQIKRLILDQL